MNKRLPSPRPQLGRKWSRLVPLLLFSAALAPLAPPAAYAQVATGARTVTGRVTSDNGEGIPGVTVVVKGTTTGATTDVNGNYSVNVPGDNSVLVFSSVGYTRQEIAVGKRTNVSQSLVPETQALNEVQVVGYGVQKKSQVTGAISSVSDEQLHDVPVANVGQALQGRAAGITVSSSGTSPGQAPTIRIRGNRSLAGSNDPLLVVDGVPYDGSLNDLNPDDITSLEVLKDASSTAIYGARGANGVILITTRRGKSGAPRVTYAGYYGQKRAYGRFDLMNGEQYYNYKLQAYRTQNPNFDPSAATFLTNDERANYLAGRTTDYQSLLFQKGHIQNHSLGISGGTDQTQYSASLGYYDETGIVPVQRFQRYSLRGTIDQQIGKRVKVGINTLNTFTDAKDPNVNVLYQILTTSPLASPYDANGQLVLYPNGDQLSNPLTLYAPNAHLDRSRRLRTFNSLYGQVNILKGLDYRLNVGLDGRTQADDSFYASVTPQNGGGVNTASRTSNIAYNLLAENILTYNRNFAEKHDLNVTALYSRQTYHADGFTGSVQNTLADYQLDTNLGAGTPTSVTNNNNQPIDWGLVSYMGRINYAYDNRYSATLTARVDQSSRLAIGHKTNLFPSAAVAWNIANESFLKDYAWVNNLKLRASLGRVGSTNINPYQTLGSLSAGLGAGYYNYGTVGAVGVVPNTIPNPSLGWEYTTTTNFGLDFGFLENRITGSVEVYQQTTSDLLLPKALPQSSGYGSVLVNAGKTQNRGLEITLTTVNLRAKNPGSFEWSTDWNFTLNREKLQDLNQYNADGSPSNDIGNQRFIGQPLYVIYDFKNIGIWQASEADQAKKYGSKPGQIKVEDVNGDGKIDGNDRVIVGSRQPKFEAGLTNRFRFKGFDLTVVALTRVGATVVDPYSFGPSYYATNTGRRNQLNFNYYASAIPASQTPMTPGGVPANPSNDYPQPDQTSRANEWPTYGSTLGYHSGTFIKVRSIDLGYTLPAAWAKAAFMSTARVYLQVQNPYIWAADKYFQRNKAIDPDALSYSSRFSNTGTASANIDFNTSNNYPVTRAFIVGVNLGL